MAYFLDKEWWEAGRYLPSSGNVFVPIGPNDATPQAIIVTGVLRDTTFSAIQAISMGASSGAGAACGKAAIENGGDPWNAKNGSTFAALISLIDCTASNTNVFNASFVSLDPGGFTMNITVNSIPGERDFYMNVRAFYGWTNAQVDIVNMFGGITSGSINYSTWTPNFGYVHSGGRRMVASVSSNLSDIRWSWGCFTDQSGITQRAAGLAVAAGAGPLATSDCNTHLSTDHVVHVPAIGGGNPNVITASFGTNQLNFSRPGSGDHGSAFWVLALEAPGGVGYDLRTRQTPASSGAYTQTVTGMATTAIDCGMSGATAVDTDNASAGGVGHCFISESSAQMRIANSLFWVRDNRVGPNADADIGFGNRYYIAAVSQSYFESVYNVAFTANGYTGTTSFVPGTQRQTWELTVEGLDVSHLTACVNGVGQQRTK